MLGAIIGDVIGSVYEWHNIKTMDFNLFDRASHYTDDTVTTVAIADALLSMPQEETGLLTSYRHKIFYTSKLREYGRKFPSAGYGAMFESWLAAETPHPYNSLGNGSAMRVSPIGFAFPTLEETLTEARWSAAVTHNHKEGIRGAMAIAAAVYLARNGETKSAIKTNLERRFGYDLGARLDAIRPTYKFDATCEGSVPQAIIAFLESDDFEEAIRKAISLGGDSDTIACMTGGIAQAYYGKIPNVLISQTNLLLDYGFKQVIRTFNERYEIRIGE